MNERESTNVEDPVWKVAQSFLNKTANELESGDLSDTKILPPPHELLDLFIETDDRRSTFIFHTGTKIPSEFAQKYRKELLIFKIQYNQYNDSDTWFQLGHAYLEENQVDHSIACWERAIELNPENQDALYNVGELYLNAKKDAEKAKGVLEKFVSKVPDDYQAWHKLGQSYDANIEIDDAERSYRQALEINPNYVPSIFFLGLLSFHYRDKDEARELIRRAIELEPELRENILSSDLDLKELVADF